MRVLGALPKVALLAGLASASVGSEKAMSAVNTGVDCEAAFAAVSDDAKYQDLAAKIAQWSSLEAQCGGTGQYELRLGALYTLANKDQQAREALTRGLRVKSEYDKDIRLSLFDLDLRQGRVADAEQGATALIAEFPQWRGGHRALGQVRLVQGRFEESVTELEAANTIEPSSGTYTLLTMAFYKLQRYRESAVSMQRALRLDRAALAHTQAVVAAAYSLVALGHVPEADDLLKQHASVQPNSAKDRSYSAAVSRVQAEIAKGNQ